MRLIDADEYKKELSTGYMFYLNEDNGKADCFECAMDSLRNMPTVEAEPVVHAHWIEEDFGSSTLYHCSKCHAECWGGGYYCHNCGAKMDEEVK